MERATVGTGAVSHFRSPNVTSLLSWWEDGELRTRFEGPLHRDGSTPDELVDLMHQVGFDFEDGSCGVTISSGPGDRQPSPHAGAEA
ncbi:DUF6461 domain-containing protein [Streptomyces sp. MMG1121]|uniref:DUF6461 domain-containing protein n=1 Tax=Streptomyces sp. MMG1121 TaxID=1415544 RepID=UPI0006AE3460|nr:hypothetical protein ADK64_37135 [Streptomyces sp. MMG1121]